MEQEEWRPVVGYEGIYEVSNLGRVKSVPRKGTKGGIMKPSPDGGGYLKVDLYKNDNPETRKVHILVMRAFAGECPAGYEIDHYDWNPRNNKLENLSYQPKEVNRARHSPEWLNNTAEAAKKRAADPKWKRKNAEAREKMFKDPEYRKKHAEGCRKAFCKPVDQFTLDGAFVKRWSSASEAVREIGGSAGHISECCKGKCKSSGGFIWRFAV